MEKEHLLLVLSHLGVISLQIGTKLQQSFKIVLSCCKLETALRCQTKLSSASQLKEPISKDLIPGVLYKFSVVAAMRSIMVRVSSTMI